MLRIYYAMVPLPPSSNKVWRTSSKGGFHTHKSPEAKDYEEMLKFDLIPLRKSIEKDFGEISKKTLKEILFNMTYFLQNERRDPANCIKLLSDALEKALGFNDRRFLFREHRKVIDKKFKRGGILLQIVPVPMGITCVNGLLVIYGHHTWNYLTNDIDAFLSEEDGK